MQFQVEKFKFEKENGMICGLILSWLSILSALASQCCQVTRRNRFTEYGRRSISLLGVEAIFNLMEFLLLHVSLNIKHVVLFADKDIF